MIDSKAKRMAKITATLFSVLLFAGQPAEAMTVKGVTLPETIEVAGNPMTLQGAGVRTKFVFSVYVGGLYLTTPTSDGAAAIAAEEPKRIVMHFLRDVGADKIRDGFADGFEANAPEAAKSLTGEIKGFLAMFAEELKEDQVVEMTYQPNKGTMVSIAGKTMGSVVGSEFMKALWAVWLGPKPPNEPLKNGMLGK